MTESSTHNAVNQAYKDRYTSPESFSMLEDCDIPSTLQLN